MKRRSDAYTSRTGVGITPSTLRTIAERRTADDSDGYGDDASGTATIQATSSTETMPSAAPTPESNACACRQVMRWRRCPAPHTASNCPAIETIRTHTIATGTWACPPARCEPSGRASCAPSAAPPKKPTRENNPTTAPLRNPPIA